MTAVSEPPTPADPADPAASPAAMVALADEAERAGRLLDAIDLLQSANRLKRDAALERRLVQLRGRAVAQLDRTPGRSSWPPRGQDLFADRYDRLPEVSVGELDLDTLSSGIGHHGGLLVRQLFSPERVARFVEGIDRSFEAYDRWAQGAPASETSPWFVEYQPDWDIPNKMLPRSYVRDGGGVWFADSPRMLFELVETFAETGLHQTVTDYLGERPATSLKKCTLRRVPVDAGNVWHQDAAFMGADLRTVNVWVALSDCGGDDSDVPALDVVPRRFDQLVETGTHGVVFSNFVGLPVVEREAGPAGIVRPRFSAGDALLFDDLFLHATATSPTMTRPRYALECWLFAPSLIPPEQGPLVF